MLGVKGLKEFKCPKELKQNKTAAVVPCLLDKLPGNLQYGVYLDNLVTSTPLLKYLYDKGYGATGTARINAGIHVDLVEKKKSDKNDIIRWGTKDLKIVAERAIAQLGWKDNSYCLFLTNMDDPYTETETMRRRPNKSDFVQRERVLHLENSLKSYYLDRR